MVYKVAINKHLHKKDWNIEIENKIVNETIAPVQTKATVPVISQNKVEEVKKINEVVKEKKQTPVVVWDDDIMKSLIASVESNILKGNLKDHTIVKNIWETKVEFIVINKMAEMLLNKEDTRKMLEANLLEITWRKLYIEIEFQTKEEYFANNL
jgi:predicted transcriptional regulator